MKPEPTAASESAAATRPKKKRKTKKGIPLVRGASAASLVKQRAAELRQSSNSSRRRKRSRTPGGGSSSSKELFSSTAESLAVISKFHTLNKRLEQNERETTISETERQENAEKIKQEQEAMGGLSMYQKASMYGAKSSKFVCADWVVPLLRQLEPAEPQQPSQSAASRDTAATKGKRRLRILDVGAIDNQYHGKGYDDWLDAVPIDLHGGQHESVLQVDFFDYAHAYCSGTDLAATGATAEDAPHEPPAPFDAVVMSLVLNFQGDPRKRGDMLALAADPRLLKSGPGGMLFVVLPSASLENSRYCDVDRFVEVVTNPLFDLELVEKKSTAKLILLAFWRRVDSLDPPGGCYDASSRTFDYGASEMNRLQPAKPGAKRNNFAVILKSSHHRS